MATRKPLVLVIDEDPGIRRLVRIVLESSALRVAFALTRADALAQARAHRPEAILVDPAASGMEGVEGIAELHETCEAPILVLAESTREDEKVRLLEAGADDYITKPFGGSELVARVRVALRRNARSFQNPADSMITVGDLRLDLAKRLVFANGSEIHLTPLEYKLFGALMRNAGAVVPQKQLLLEIWGPDHNFPRDHLRVVVSQLRHKLEKNPRCPRYLMTEPLVGYRIRIQP